MFRRHRKLVGTILCFVVFIVGFSVLIYFIHEANVKDFREEISMIRQYCGPKKAFAFEALYDYNDHSSDTAREWVMECLAD